MSHSFSSSRQLYQTVLTDFLEPRLAEEGFKRFADDWFYRWTGDLLSRVSADFRRDGQEDRGVLDVSVGVGFKSLGNFLRPCLALEGHGAVEKKPCMLASGLERLRPMREPNCWWIDPETVAEELATELLGDIDSLALPYFEKFGTVERVVQEWERIRRNEGLLTGEGLYLAGAHWFFGDQERAMDVLKELEERFKVRLQQGRSQASAFELGNLKIFREWLIEQPSGPLTGATHTRSRPHFRSK